MVSSSACIVELIENLVLMKPTTSYAIRIYASVTQRQLATQWQIRAQTGAYMSTRFDSGEK